MGDLHDDADSVRDVLDRIGESVVLVGHYYGGAVITDAGEHPAVAHLVYLCALALDADETCGSAAAAEAVQSDIAHTGLAAGIIIDEEGIVTVDPTVAAECLFNHREAETVRWALSRLGPQPFVTLQQAPRRVTWRAKPSTYVVCSDDRAVPSDLQRVLATRCTRTVEWESDHSPFLPHPEQLVELLVDLAFEAATSSAGEL